MDVCPLIFEPIFKPKVWGRDNLARLLGKKLPSDERFGESWECADLENGQSVVARGPAKGKTLHELVEAWGKDLLGRAELADGRFPLLIKYLDAAEDLSVQVHPDPETAKRLGGQVRVKHEAWHIIQAEQDACIYRGLTPGTSVDSLRQAMNDRPEAILDHLQKVPVKAGQTYFLPSGTLHALGAGVVVAEIQTPSDITYRLYDWGRVRPESDAGLHIEQGLACVRADIDFSQFEKRSHVSSVFTTVTRLVTCPSFIIEKIRFMSEFEQEIPYAEPVCWIILEGRGEVRYGKGGVESFERGDVVVLPAALKEGRIQAHTDCAWLEVTIPTESDLADHPRADRAYLQAREGTAGHPVSINIQKNPPETA
ncbi:MAG: class I mannose-6-phosphate isomerase [Phycisphaerales bacterium]|nr:class I mannose-6-phosphate isomerase [Phycisphaerales bacterium]